jgi:hypothetical protein
VILLAVAVVILPRLVSQEAVKQRIASTLSSLSGGSVQYRQVALQFRPLPRMVFESSAIHIPGRLTGTIRTITVYPKLLPLFTGRIEIGRLGIVSPRLRIQLPEGTAPAASPPAVAQKTRSSAIRILGREIAGMVSGIGRAFQGEIRIGVRDGTVTLAPEMGKPMDLEHLRGSLDYSPSRITLSLREGSHADGEAKLSIDLNPRSMTGRGKAHLSRFSPQDWMAILFPHSPLGVGKSRLDLDLDLTFGKSETLSGTIGCALAELTLIRPNSQLELRNAHLSGTFSLGPKRTELSLSTSNLPDPGMKVSGHFLSDGGLGTHQWNISAKNLNLASTGRLVRFLAKGIRPLESAFRILQAGQVSEIQLSDSADSLEGLKKAEGLKIRGYLQEGTVYVPKPDLLLTHATGWVNVQGRTLTGNDLRVHLGKAKGRGFFSMTFTKHPPFVLNAAVTADLSELPPLLGRLVPNEIFRKEMASIHGAEGAAEGHLRIDDTGEGMDVRVDVSRMDLSGTYERIPYPIHIRQGRFHYDENRIQLENLKGRIGASEFSDLAADIGLHAPFPLTINGKASQADSGEIIRWLKQYESIAQGLSPFQQVSGPVSLSAFSMKGPAIFPSQWQVNLTGKVKGLQLATRYLPSPVTFLDGQFKADQDTIRFDDTHLQAMDSRIEARGALSAYLTSHRRIQATVSGSVGPESATWAKKALGVPAFLAWQSAWSLSPMDLRWNGESDFALAGRLSVPHGPILHVDLEKSPGCLAIHRLGIHDAMSDACLSLTASENAIDLSFSGELKGESVSRIVGGPPFFSGLIAGDATYHVQLSAPHVCTASGDLLVQHLDLSRFGVPLAINDANLSGGGNVLRVRKTALDWHHQPMHLDGTITGLDDGLNLDLVASMEKVQWSDLKDFFSPQAAPASQTNTGPKREIPLFGSLKVHVDSLAITDGMAFHPLEGQLDFYGGKTSISITRANACGIELTGNVSSSPDAFRLEATPSAKNQDLATTLACLCNNKEIITGHFNLKGQLSASGKADTPLAKTLSGWVSLKATKGRIMRFGLMAKLFTLLNVAGLFQGDLPDLEHKGFPYKTTRATATFDKGILHITNGEINSNAMRIFFQGKEDLTKKTHELTIVVAPLKTVDFLVSHIPLVRDVLDRGLVIYPITVSGTWEKPDLHLLAPDAVGVQIWGIVARTLKLPLKILDPLFSGGKKK